MVLFSVFVISSSCHSDGYSKLYWGVWFMLVP
jgi:hypothetical protein